MPSRYLIIEVTDLQTRVKSYKIYVRGTTHISQPVERNIPTRERAEARVRELDASDVGRSAPETTRYGFHR